MFKTWPDLNQMKEMTMVSNLARALLRLLTHRDLYVLTQEAN